MVLVGASSVAAVRRVGRVVVWALRMCTMIAPAGVDFFAQRYLALLAQHDDAATRLAAVDELIDHARKVSPSPAMTVYVGDLEVALGRRAETVRGIVGAES